MAKTKYIKGKDGRFQGSIGSGKSSIPVSMTAPTATPAPSESATPTVDVSVPLNPYDVPSYVKSFADRDASPIPHSPIDRDLLPTCPAQESFEEYLTNRVQAMEFALEEEGSLRDMFAADVDKAAEDPEAALFDVHTSQGPPVSVEADHAISMRDKANELRQKGHYHQAYALEYVAAAFEDIESKASLSRWYDEKSANQDHMETMHQHSQSDDPWNPDLAYQAACIIECEPAVDTTALFADAEELARGAVILDYMNATGNDDPETAAALSALLPNPYAAAD